MLQVTASTSKVSNKSETTVKGSTTKDVNPLQVMASTAKDEKSLRVTASTAKDEKSQRVTASTSKNVNPPLATASACKDVNTPQVTGSFSKDASSLQIGMIITHKVGRWKVVRNIASGPFSEVFVVVDADNEKAKYAMKCERQEGNQRFSVPTALRVLQQTLRRLEVLHDAGWLCR
ncbi:hypothetical protein TELCIR_03341 [Teladorsagia circumcincta]|uniref:Protein kinase domain-containing protein n=1 Tax=Teladorsagia circumcincta TaxID=45464 RepID=A0A2G9UWL0_TELCI|nr:hypothetical protein TELCIR_03341 [Teladorsagia circumcincta]